MAKQPPLKRQPYVWQLLGRIFDPGRGVHDKVLHETTDPEEMQEMFTAAVKAARQDSDILHLGVYRVGYPGCWQSWERDVDPSTNHGSQPSKAVKGKERSVP